MSLSKDTEAKDLAISLFWTSEYVKDNEIKPELRLYKHNESDGLKRNIGYYIHKDNVAQYNNFSCILDDLIRDKVYFIKKH